MNTQHNLSISTVSIEIKVVQIAGHKMTKATFRQMPYMYPFRYREFDSTEDPVLIEGVNILGKVWDDVWYLFFEAEGEPFTAKVHTKDAEWLRTHKEIPQLFIST
jgi:hypothetical protein